MPEGQPEQAPAARKRGRSSKKLIAILIAGGVALVAAIVLIIMLINNAANKTISIFQTDAFFVETKEDGSTKYALFKNDGSKLTDFNFRQVGTFVNGYAFVENLDGKGGIIDHTGKMTVDFGEYDNIVEHMGIYSAGKDQTEKLILGNGDELATDYDSSIFASDSPYAVVKTDKYVLYNALGQKLADFQSDEDPVFSDDDPETVSALSYKGALIILNNKKYDVRATIADLGTVYDIDEATEDGKYVTFSQHDNHYGDGAKRAIYSGDTFVELGDTCKDLNIRDNFSDKKRVYATCSKDDKEFLIRKNEVADIVVNTYGEGYSVYDENHYAHYIPDEKKIEFYVDGNKKNTIDADYRMTVSIKGYQVNSYKHKTVTLYDFDGNEAFKLTDTSAASELTGIDYNGNIIVRDSKKDNTERYVIVNKNGEELSGHYYSIGSHGEYYTAANRNNNTMDLLDKNGKVIVSGEYSEYTFYQDDKYILGRKGDTNNRQYDLIDVDGKSVKATLEGTITFYKYCYFRTNLDNKVRYYTLDGKLVHEYES